MNIRLGEYVLTGTTAQYELQNLIFGSILSVIIVFIAKFGITVPETTAFSVPFRFVRRILRFSSFRIFLLNFIPKI